MRIAPHVVWTRAHGDDLETLFRRVVEDGVATHGHPRALVGALTFAAALHFALSSSNTLAPNDLVEAARTGLISPDAVARWVPSAWFQSQDANDYFAVWDRTNSEAASLLTHAQESIEQGSMSDSTETLRDLGALGQYGGSGTISAVAAVYLASRAGNRPIGGLLQAAFQHGADTDTIASMTGSLLGAVHGETWLGQLRRVQDYNYIGSLAEAVARDSGLPYEGRVIPSRTVKQRLDAGDDLGSFADGRGYRVLSRSVLSERPWVVRTEIELQDGQTSVIDRLYKQVPPHSVLGSAAPVESASELDIVEPGESPSARGLKVTVTLPAADVQAIAAFYSHVIGSPLAPSNRAVRVGDSVVFVQAAAEPSLWSADAHLEVDVDDLKGASARLRQPVVRDDRGQKIQVIDPDGRVVTVRSRSDG